MLSGSWFSGARCSGARLSGSRAVELNAPAPLLEDHWETPASIAEASLNEAEAFTGFLDTTRLSARRELKAPSGEQEELFLKATELCFTQRIGGGRFCCTRGACCLSALFVSSQDRVKEPPLALPAQGGEQRLRRSVGVHGCAQGRDRCDRRVSTTIRAAAKDKYRAKEDGRLKVHQETPKLSVPMWVMLVSGGVRVHRWCSTPSSSFQRGFACERPDPDTNRRSVMMKSALQENLSLKRTRAHIYQLGRLLLTTLLCGAALTACASETDPATPEGRLLLFGAGVAEGDGAALYAMLSQKSKDELSALRAGQAQLKVSLESLPEEVQESFRGSIPAPLRANYSSDAELFSALTESQLTELRAQPRAELLQGFARVQERQRGDRLIIKTRGQASFELIEEEDGWKIASFEERLQSYREWITESLPAIESSRRELTRRQRLNLD